MATKDASARRAPDLPTVMQAAAIDAFGPPSALTIHTLPVPEPGPHDVLIAIHAAGVGIWDARIREGVWAEGDERFPLVLGTDGAGAVVAKGVDVDRFRLFDRVWAYEYENPKGGFYAQYVSVHADHVGHVPKQLDLLHAGASAVTGLTALQGIDDHLDVRHRETLLIFGASGAVGTLAIQFAKRRLARVIATATGPAATTLVRELGADGVIDPRDGDAADRLRRLAPDGLDAALALAGSDALERLLELLRPDGRVAYPNGVEPEPRRRPGIRVTAYDAVAGPREFEALARAVAEAHLRVPIAGVYPLEQTAQAHELIEKGHVLGRVVLRIGEEADAPKASERPGVRRR